jgi:hypothetical protein
MAEMVRLARGENRTISPDMEDAFIARLDPAGVHVVLRWSFNDDTSCIRCSWLVKMLDRELPESVTLDILPTEWVNRHRKVVL